MKKTILFLLLPVIFLTGCFPKERIIIKTQIVKVLVPVKPSGIPNYPLVQYPVDSLAKDSTSKQVVKAYFDSLAICFAEVEKRDNILQVIRNFETEKQEIHIETLEAK